jgi:hypothetical protein
MQVAVFPWDTNHQGYVPLARSFPDDLLISDDRGQESPVAKDIRNHL